LTTKQDRVFNIIILNPDPYELKKIKSIYLDILRNQTPTSPLKEYSVKVHGLKELNEIDVILKKETNSETANFLIHLPESINGLKGWTIIDLIRRRHPERNLETILHAKKEITDEEDLAYLRNHGINKVIFSADKSQIITALEALAESLIYRSKPEKKRSNAHFIFKPIETEAELEAYYSKRFDVWKKLMYVAPKQLSIRNPLEIDEYDKKSIPLGGFAVEEKEELAALVRIITPHYQEKYIKMTRNILERLKDDILTANFEREIKSCFPTLKDESKTYFVNSFLEEYGGLENAVEFSRMIVTDTRFKGISLSTAMAQFHNMYAKFVLQATVGIAGCLTAHVDFNINKNGFKGLIPETDKIYHSGVEKVASAIYVDFANIQNKPPSFHRDAITRMYNMFRTIGWTCFCDKKCSYLHERQGLDLNDELTQIIQCCGWDTR